MKAGVDFVGVGVGAVIVDSRGRLFLAKRGEKAKNERGCWEFPGGSVEFGETLADGLKREMQEEYGIKISVGKLLDVIDHILPREGQHWVSPTYICKVVSGEPRIIEPKKCAEIGWFALDEIPEPLSVISRENLQHYRSTLLANSATPSTKAASMKHFLVHIQYKVPVEQLGDTVRQHREFLQVGYERGWLLMSGPREPKTAGIVVARAPSREELAGFFENDPYKVMGLADHEFTEFDPVKFQPFLTDWVTGLE
ncbi:MAG: NUDIX domain-containing protein [Bellilinea sp.]